MNKENISMLVREEMKNYIINGKEKQVDESLLLGAAVGLASGFFAGAFFINKFVTSRMRQNFLLRMFNERYLKKHMEELKRLEEKSKVMLDQRSKAEIVRTLDKLYEDAHEMKKNLPTYLVPFEQEYNGGKIPDRDVAEVQRMLDGIIKTIEKVKKQTTSSNWRKIGSLVG